jgi:hypothetical protein
MPQVPAQARVPMTTRRLRQEGLRRSPAALPRPQALVPERASVPELELAQAVSRAQVRQPPPTEVAPAQAPVQQEQGALERAQTQAVRLPRAKGQAVSQSVSHSRVVPVASRSPGAQARMARPAVAASPQVPTEEER